MPLDKGGSLGPSDIALGASAALSHHWPFLRPQASGAGDAVWGSCAGHGAEVLGLASGCIQTRVCGTRSGTGSRALVAASLCHFEEAGSPKARASPVTPRCRGSLGQKGCYC